MTEPHAILFSCVNELAMRFGEAICDATSRTTKIDPCKPSLTRSKDAGGVDVPHAIHALVLERAFP